MPCHDAMVAIICMNERVGWLVGLFVQEINKSTGWRVSRRNKHPPEVSSYMYRLPLAGYLSQDRRQQPHHTTPHHTTPRHATPRHATPRTHRQPILISIQTTHAEQQPPRQATTADKKDAGRTLTHHPRESMHDARTHARTHAHSHWLFIPRDNLRIRTPDGVEERPVRALR